MFALLKREIADKSLSYLVAVALSGCAIILLLMTGHFSGGDGPAGLYLLPILPIIGGHFALASIIGASQIYTDRSQRISAFLCTLSVTRRRLFVAKVLAGILLVLSYLLPVMIVGTLVIPKMTMPIPPVWIMYRELCVAALVLYLAAYSIGLAFGWLLISFNPAWLAPAPAALLIPLVIVKGPGFQGLAYLIVLAGACVLYSWHRFARASF